MAENGDLAYYSLFCIFSDIRSEISTGAYISETSSYNIEVIQTFQRYSFEKVFSPSFRFYHHSRNWILGVISFLIKD